MTLKSKHERPGSATRRSGKAARYFRETNQFFVNLLYSATEAAQKHLEVRYATYGDLQLVRELALRWAERLIMGRVG
jgi:hypothetical protein